MVFTKLSPQEKDAFFGLLDEYFQSRPEIFGQNGNGQSAGGQAGTGISTAAATSLAQRALAASATTSSTGSRSNNPFAASMSGVDAAQAMSVGRVAAASLAFNSGTGPEHTYAPSSSIDGSSSHRRTPIDHVSLPGIEVDKLVTKKTGMISAFKKQTPPGTVTIPSAFAAPRNTYGPPPVRRMGSETNTTGGALRQAAPSPAPEPESEGVAGEWAEALYDYSSEDPGDLAIKAGTRVLITTRSSEDWWTGQVEGQGREGLFPASYVKLL